MSLLLFRLCLQLGIPHPRYLLRQLNSRDVAEWIAYANIEPFGAPQDELLHGMRCAIAVNGNPYRRDGEPPAEVTDFMPSHEPVPQSPDSIMSAVREWKELARGDNR